MMFDLPIQICSWLRALLWAVLICKHSVLAEEKSVLEGASVDQFDLWSGYTDSNNALIDGGFYSRMTTTKLETYGKDKEFQVILPESIQITSVFVAVRGLQTAISHVWIGDDATHFSTSLTKCSQDMPDTGFFLMQPQTKGKYVVLRRTGYNIHGSGGNHKLNFYELRVYQTPNILQKLEATSQVTISAPAPTESKYAADNLIKNLASREQTRYAQPAIDFDLNKGNYYSCFITSNSQLAAEGNILRITIDLGQSYFQHAILAVQGVANSANTELPQEELLQNLRFHVGDDPDYTQNVECEGGPFLVWDDSKSYVNAKGVDQWKYGIEVWCNKQGRYTTIVSDLTHLAGKIYEISLCHLGIMGT